MENHLDVVFLYIFGLAFLAGLLASFILGLFGK